MPNEEERRKLSERDELKKLTPEQQAKLDAARAEVLGQLPGATKPKQKE